MVDGVEDGERKGSNNTRMVQREIGILKFDCCDSIIITASGGPDSLHAVCEWRPHLWVLRHPHSPASKSRVRNQDNSGAGLLDW